MEIIIVILLIVLNGFFSLSEIALISSKKIRLEHLKEQNSKGAKYALKLLDNSENFLSSIQVGITLIGIITGFYGGVSLAKYLTPLFVWMNVSPTASYGISVTISIAIITFFFDCSWRIGPENDCSVKTRKGSCKSSSHYLRGQHFILSSCQIISFLHSCNQQNDGHFTS